jgi:predicted alpha/beta hydrolase family esterase
MQQQVLFIHGGGEDGYHADLVLMDSLLELLGEHYSIRYPQMPNDEHAADFGWLNKIGTEIISLSDAEQGVVVVGHSLGASMLLKFLSERTVSAKLSGAFLLAAPFWTGNQNWVQGLKLAKNFEKKLPKDVPFYFYQCKDDEEVSFGDLDKYRKRVTEAQFTELEKGGHQFQDQLSCIAHDIKAISPLRNP